MAADSVEIGRAMREWIDARVFPQANAWEESQALPPDVLDEFAAAGWFGAGLPEEWGGLNLQSEAMCRFCAEMGRGSVSLLSLFTVHNMVSQAVLRWGTPEQRASWLPLLASGRTRAAFALTEPDFGSDAAGIQCRVRREDDRLILSGAKKWISGSCHAQLFLVMARMDDEGVVALLVPADTPGLTVTPMKDLLGFRAAGIARLDFADCVLPASSLLGSVGGGFTFVASHALDHGRFTVGCGCVGVLEACLECSVIYAKERTQFGQALRKHQLIQEMIANMATDLEAARALVLHAGRERDAMSPDSIMLVTTAKYFCSRAALRAASDAVQIHGGNGCSPDYPVMRYYRDAKICEIIEGSSQMQQLMISNQACMRLRAPRRRRNG